MPRRNAYDATPSEDVVFLTKYVIERATLPMHIRRAALEVRISFLESRRVPIDAFATVVVDVLERYNEGQRMTWRAGVAAENLAKWFARRALREGRRYRQRLLAELHAENLLSEPTNPGKSSPPD